MNTPTLEAIEITVAEYEHQLECAEHEYAETLGALRDVMEELDNATKRLSERTTLLADISTRAANVERALTRMRNAKISYMVAQQTLDIVREQSK